MKGSDMDAIHVDGYTIMNLRKAIDEVPKDTRIQFDPTIALAILGVARILHKELAESMDGTQQLQRIVDYMTWCMYLGTQMGEDSVMTPTLIKQATGMIH